MWGRGWKLEVKLCESSGFKNPGLLSETNNAN